MLDPSKRFATIVLAVGAAVLLIAIAVGEHMGDRVIGQATERTLQSVVPPAVTPAPESSTGAYGPDWKRSETLSAAGDPRFPDPRVPPQPLPTQPPTPAPKQTQTPPPTPTPNPNIPIWRQQPLPSPLAPVPENFTAPPSPAAAPSEGVPGSSPP
jgi:hypothetical protein